MYPQRLTHLTVATVSEEALNEQATTVKYQLVARSVLSQSNHGQTQTELLAGHYPKDQSALRLSRLYQGYQIDPSNLLNELHQ